MSTCPIRLPTANASSAVTGVTVWTRVSDGSPSWILPDGCIDVLWNGHELTVAGPDTTAHHASPQPGTSYTALRFASGVAPTVLGVAADGLRDQRPGLADVIGADDTERLAESLLATDDPSGELELWAGRRLAYAGGPDRTMCRVAVTHRRWANRGGGRGADRVQRASAEPSLTRLVRLRTEGAGAGAAPSACPGLGAAVGCHWCRRRSAPVMPTKPTLPMRSALTGQSASQLVGSAANRSTPLPSGSRNVA